jgi:hypothetical protein
MFDNFASRNVIEIICTIQNVEDVDEKMNCLLHYPTLPCVYYTYTLYPYHSALQ